MQEHTSKEMDIMIDTTTTRRHSDRAPRILAAVGLAGGMIALWAGAVYHNGDVSTSAAMLADAAAHPTAPLVQAGTFIAETVFFTLAAIGLAGVVRGRGRAFLLSALAVLAVGLPSHAIGATAGLAVRATALSGIPHQQQVAVVDSLANVQGFYFGLVPVFLLGLVLTTASLWRARVVGWQPFALLLGDLVVGQVLFGDSAQSSWQWWVSPVVTVSAFVWLAIGILRYRPAPVPVTQHAEELVAV
jgi:hypothetical protein